MTWREVVASANARGFFTAEEVDRAASWASCAVGEQHKAMPEVVVYGPWKWGQEVVPGGEQVEPVDGEFDRLGMRFASAVEDNLFGDADEVLDAIEDRVLVLKRGQP